MTKFARMKYLLKTKYQNKNLQLIIKVDEKSTLSVAGLSKLDTLGTKRRKWKLPI